MARQIKSTIQECGYRGSALGTVLYIKIARVDRKPMGHDRGGTDTCHDVCDIW